MAIKFSMESSSHYKTSIAPYFLYMQQGKFQQVNIGFKAKKGPLSGGLWYRNDDAFILQIGVETKQLKMGYSYDITISKLGLSNTTGAHEISLQTTLKCDKTKESKVQIDKCFWE